VIILTPEQLSEIEDAATAAYPKESCGLLIGQQHSKNSQTVTRVAVSPNKTENDTRDSFEIDPQLRFDIMRELKDTSEDIVGHFHSHPNGPAHPSARDLEQAWEPALIWVITSIKDGTVGETAAFRYDEKERQFSNFEIEIAVGH
jgi:proteasome lid subunit RPN8/RPN11